MLAGSPQGVLRGRGGEVKIGCMDATPKRSRLSLLLPVLTLLAALLASVIGVGAASAAGASCRFDPGTGEVRVDGSAVSVRRDGGELVFREAGQGELACLGGRPELRNVDEVRIAMIEGTIYESVHLDQRDGRLSASGISYELRFTNANNEDEGAAVEVIGGERADRIAIGRSGNRAALDLRGGQAGGEPDVVIRARKGFDLAVSGGKGDDTIDAFGALFETGDGPIGGGAADLRLFGRGGADEIHGSGEDDLLLGDEGHDVLDGHGGDDRVKGGSHSDTLLGGAGDDVLLARDGLEDLAIDCGAGGEDEAKADALDEGQVSGCETVSVP